MLSILPPHIVSRVLSDLKSHLENRGTSEESKCERLFSNSYIEKHENVRYCFQFDVIPHYLKFIMCYISLSYDFSILFSDMVNSVKLTSTLTAKQLVIVLNELFGCFDEIANVNTTSVFLVHHLTIHLAVIFSYFYRKMIAKDYAS